VAPHGCRAWAIPAAIQEGDATPAEIAAQAAQAYLWSRGELAGFLHVQAAAHRARARSHLLSASKGSDTTRVLAESLSRITICWSMFSYRRAFTVLQRSLEIGQWWMR
jgi:hypothetical protein